MHTIYIYNLYDIWRVKLGKTQNLPTTLLQGSGRIWRFIDIVGLSSQLDYF